MQIVRQKQVFSGRSLKVALFKGFIYPVLAGATFSMLNSSWAGGFGADFTSNSLLAQYRPDLLHLPTTNGEHCTGDGIKMGEVLI